MATLAADIAVVFDPRYPTGLVQRPATGADTYYRGGLASSITATGLITLAPAATAYHAGVVMEHKVVAAANELVWLGTRGSYFFACVLFTLANTDKTFATLAATLFDNPADLGLATAGTAGTVGVLTLCTSDAVNGWLNTDMRAAIENA